MEWFRVPQKIYFKKGCLPIALRELKEVYDRKKAVVLVDDDGFRNGIAKPVTDQLDQMHIFYSLIAVEYSQNSVPVGLDAVKKFEPDCLIAVGDKAISIGKMIRILYENPELTFEQLPNWNNIRDRSLKSLHTGKLYFTAVAASESTGRETSILSLEAENYALLPDMSIIDTDMLLKENIQIIANMCAYALFFAIRAFASAYLSDYAYGLAVQAMQLVFRYFPEYQQNPDSQYALERLVNAVEMASMAFSNAYEGERSLKPNWNPAADALGITPEELKNRFSEIHRIAFPESV